MRFSFLVKNYPLPKKEETWDIIMIREAQKETDEILKKTRNFINLCEKTVYYHWCTICRYEYSCPIPNPHVYACESCWDELEGDA